MESVDKLLLRPDEAAELLGISRSKLYGLLAAGVLPSVKLGKSVRISTAALRKWVEERDDSRASSGTPEPEFP